VQENASVVEDPEKHSLLTLPYPAVVAGDRFREVYYWDSYFIVRGLIVSGMTQTAMVPPLPSSPLPPSPPPHLPTARDRLREVYHWDFYSIVRGLIVSGMTQTAMVPLPPHTHKHFHTFTHPSFHLRALVQMPTVGDNFWGL